MALDIDGPEGPDYDRVYWWGALERVAELIHDDPEFVDFDLDDFMVMCGYTQSGMHMIAYTHIHTRRSITLSDDAARVYRYEPPTGGEPRGGDDEDLGHYCADTLRSALGRLELPLGAELRRNLIARANEVGVDDGDL